MEGPIPVSVIVMTRNEAANIARCLAPLTAFAQVVVVDSHSDDGTAAIATAKGAELISFRWNGMYPKKKQWCLSHPGIRHDWVLFVDADEYITPQLVVEIGTLMESAPRHSAYFVDSRPVWLGRLLRHGTPYRKIALLHRRRARFPICPDLHVSRMWEVEGHYQPMVDGTVGHLTASLIHNDAKPPAAWFERHNRYSDWEAALAGSGRTATLIAGERGGRRLAKRLLARLPGRPLLAFLHAYLWHLGFLDGKAGLHHALSRAFYYWSIDLKRDWLATTTAASQPDISGARLSDVADQPALTLSSGSPASVFTNSNVRRRTDSSGIR
ncbi:glycosyltransferase family 2 protein [Niveispirillum sp.]|uniref:glycosyltransferase family 2 protein n=1 Tax=Niveispirillum sp. TaxID=1917217 RepID=UPI001B463B12|nr:glycosyltransferase family 2 protein [Niveispirillum sp.]MBP7339003.1 glycosyltransferase family 2 protein [Niveispirillum sp.]